MEKLKGYRITVFKYLSAFYTANWLGGSQGKITPNPWRFRETDRFSLVKWNTFAAFFLSHGPKIKLGNSEVFALGHI